jgi:hypothetical protein
MLMLALDQLSSAIAAYRSGHKSLDEFADWFRASSRSMFGESKNVLDVCLSIEHAFSRLDFEGISEESFRSELASINLLPSPLPEPVFHFEAENPKRATLFFGENDRPKAFSLPVLGTGSGPEMDYGLSLVEPALALHR